MDGMKLWLEGDIALDKRNSRWKDAELSWRVGVNQMAKTIDATQTALSREATKVGDVLTGSGQLSMEGLSKSTLSGFNPFSKDFWVDSPEQADQREQRKQSYARFETYREEGAFEEMKQDLFARDEERNARIADLRNRQTQYALTQKQIEQFGVSAWEWDF